LSVRLLVTRPEPDAERTASALRVRGHSVIVAPLLRIEALPDAEIGSGPWAAILVTSANAAAAIVQHPRGAELKDVPVLAVGEHSAQAMRAAGFAEVISAAGDGGDLVRLAAERLKQSVPLLYLAGADRSGDIAGDLAAQNFTVRVAVIYRAVAATALPRAAVDALAGGIDGVLHFSRRSAEVYVNAARSAGLLEAALKKPRHFCLSVQVAEPLTQAGAADIRIGPQPTEAALLAVIGAA
jgi:uroporphyrinogen-III synthase